MLRAAVEVIGERGFPETRIADVAKRAGASSALVIYYFGTKDRLLTDALRYSEELSTRPPQRMLAEVSSAARAARGCSSAGLRPEGDGRDPGAWGLWLDLWAQALRHTEVARRAATNSTSAGARMIADIVAPGPELASSRRSTPRSSP